MEDSFLFWGIKCELISYSYCNVTLIDTEYVEPIIFQNILFKPLKWKCLSFLITPKHYFIMRSAVFCMSPFFGSEKLVDIIISESDQECLTYFKNGLRKETEGSSSWSTAPRHLWKMATSGTGLVVFIADRTTAVNAELCGSRLVFRVREDLTVVFECIRYFFILSNGF